MACDCERLRHELKNPSTTRDAQSRALHATMGACARLASARAASVPPKTTSRHPPRRPVRVRLQVQRPGRERKRLTAGTRWASGSLRAFLNVHEPMTHATRHKLETPLSAATRYGFNCRESVFHNAFVSLTPFPTRDMRRSRPSAVGALRRPPRLPPWVPGSAPWLPGAA